jgi:hypothetical protein
MIKNMLQAVAFGGLAVLSMAPASGQVLMPFDIKTVAAAGSTVITERLFSGTSGNTVVPSGSALWFVADNGTGGMPTGNVTQTFIDSIKTGSGSLQLAYTDITPGDLGFFSAPDGAYSRVGVQLDSAFTTKPIYAVLWSDANHDGVIGNSGDTFGWQALHNTGMPSLGNPVWEITSNMYAGQDLVLTAVPEPAAYASAVGVMCLVGAVVRRRIAK